MGPCTHSDHLQLDAPVRHRLLDELTVALGALRERFEVSLRTELLAAIRQ